MPFDPYSSGFPSPPSSRRSRPHRQDSGYSSSSRAVSPLGSSRYEQPWEPPTRGRGYETVERSPSIRRSPALRYDAVERSALDRFASNPMRDVIADVGISSFYSRDPFESRHRMPPHALARLGRNTARYEYSSSVRAPERSAYEPRCATSLRRTGAIRGRRRPSLQIRGDLGSSGGDIYDTMIDSQSRRSRPRPDVRAPLDIASLAGDIYSSMGGSTVDYGATYSTYPVAPDPYQGRAFGGSYTCPPGYFDAERRDRYDSNYGRSRR